MLVQLLPNWTCKYWHVKNDLSNWHVFIYLKQQSQELYHVTSFSQIMTKAVYFRLVHVHHWAKTPTTTSYFLAAARTLIKTKWWFIFIFSHLADAFIQSDLQMRTIEAIKTNKRSIKCKCYAKSWLAQHSTRSIFFLDTHIHTKKTRR